MKPARILIGTPTANGELCTEYCEAIFDLKQHFAKKYPYVIFDICFLETYDLRVVRNVYASMVLNDKKYTHLFFFDSDMGFFPTLMEKMLEADKPVVSVVSPKRSLELKDVAEHARKLKDIRLAEIIANGYIPDKASYRFGVDADDRKTVVAIDNDGSLLPVHRCGTGIMLIHRSVFEAFRDRIPQDYVAEAPAVAASYGVKGGYIRCFDAVRTATSTTLGEDYAFTDRWVTRLGGKIYLVYDEIIFHVGDRRTIGNAAVRYENRRRGIV